MSTSEYNSLITISLTRLTKAVNHLYGEGNILLHEWISSVSASHISILLAQNWLLGILIIGAIVFCETGLVFAPFFPGDSLLFTAGVFLGSSHISPVVPWAILGLSAVLGDGLNYSLGRSAWSKKNNQ
ncbi:hypothetical protein ABK905_16970 [Acerihabitans sp. KWT182]|uniref:DedA family protein n=1 Tax=Acerihabitans sp. KWT182 TaxID=3157919 RepID=A0AAU7Q603_9GAMM